MRTAHKVWVGIAAGVFCLVAITDLSGGGSTTTASPATPAGVAVPAPTSAPTTVPVPSTATSTTAATPSTVTVSRVIDGYSLELSDGRQVQLVGLDACDVSTPGGRAAKSSLESLTSGQQVQVLPGGTRDADASGRLLRRLESVSYGSGTDLGGLMVVRPAVGVKEGQGASPDYLTELRSSDDGARRCSGPSAPTGSSTGSSTDGPDFDGPDLDGPTPGDQGLPDGALTGGYCAKKWWC